MPAMGLEATWLSPLKRLLQEAMKSWGHDVGLAGA
ncbi:hypothetical protein C8J98_102362 [Luteibacter sp. OK325]|nr:hypothetical protein C8J98_102362 [Luteibacter sp. OK325]